MTLPADYPETTAPVIYARSDRMDQIMFNKALRDFVVQNAEKPVMLDVINWISENSHEYLIGWLTKSIDVEYHNIQIVVKVQLNAIRRRSFTVVCGFIRTTYTA